jgi:calcium-dependent protein kinase
MGCGNTKGLKILDPDDSGKLSTDMQGTGVVQSYSSTLIHVNITPASFIKYRKGGIDPSIYTQISKVGNGSFSEVIKVLHIPTNQLRAAKVIHKAGLTKYHLREDKVLNEVMALTSLDHPNILRIYEIFEDDLRYYIITEICNGGELFGKIVKLKHFSEDCAADFMRQLFSAVAYCHSKSIIHRDLKPENILLDEIENSLTIKVADFGSSCIFDVDRKLTGCFGSPYYVAPEVVQGRYDEKCDVWSCGVIMYILLTGRPPYPGRTEREILRQVRDSPLRIAPEKLQNLSYEAIDLLRKLLTVDPVHRISAAQALSHPWVSEYRPIDDKEIESQTLLNLNEFHSAAKLKEAVHVYIATQLTSKEELKYLRAAFAAIDQNGDGRINKQELIEQYERIMGTKKAEIEVEKTFRRIDFDSNGFIDYSEFLSACLDEQLHISKRNLDLVFNAFDTDKNGTISASELREVLNIGEMDNDSVWQDIINEVDSNGDGEIDLQEFYELMSRNIHSGSII